MNTDDLTRYIDDWLDDNAWRVDARVIDFVLDVRLALAGEWDPAELDEREPVGASG